MIRSRRRGRKRSRRRGKGMRRMRKRGGTRTGDGGRKSRSKVRKKNSRRRRRRVSRWSMESLRRRKRILYCCQNLLDLYNSINIIYLCMGTDYTLK